MRYRPVDHYATSSHASRLKRKREGTERVAGLLVHRLMRRAASFTPRFSIVMSGIVYLRLQLTMAFSILLIDASKIRELIFSGRLTPRVLSIATHR